MLTTLGSSYSPQTVEGRVLAFIIALYAFAVFGYVTATIASYFVGREAAEPSGSVAGSEEVRALRQEIAALRGQVDRLSVQPQQASRSTADTRLTTGRPRL